MIFSIERYSYFGTTYTLRLPWIPCLPWPYSKVGVGVRKNDDVSPNDCDAETISRKVIKSKCIRYGGKAASNASFKFIDTYGK